MTHRRSARRTKPLTARQGEAPAKGGSRPWKKPPDRRRRRRSRPHAPRRAAPHIPPPDSMPALTPQTGRLEKALEIGSRCAQPGERPGRGSSRGLRSGAARVSYSLAPEDSARAEREHRQKNYEIDRQGPFVSPKKTR